MCYCTLLQYSCFRVSTLSDPEARSVTCTWSEMIYVRSECCLLTDRTWSIYIYLHNPHDDDESLMVRPIHDLIIDWAWIVLGANILLLHQAPKQVESWFRTSLAHNNEFTSPVVYFCWHKTSFSFKFLSEFPSFTWKVFSTTGLDHGPSWQCE